MSGSSSVSTLVRGENMPKRRGRPRTVMTERQKPRTKEVYAASTWLAMTERAAKRRGMSWNAWAVEALKAALDRERGTT